LQKYTKLEIRYIKIKLGRFFLFTYKLCFLLLFLAVNTANAQVDTTNSVQPFDNLIKKDSTLNDTTANAAIANDSVKKKGSDLDEPVKYSAKDSMFIDMENKTVHLYGDAKVTYKDIELKAGYISLATEDQIVYATGTIDSSGNMSNYPTFKDGKEEFQSHWMRYNFKTKKGFVYFVKTKQGEGTLIGDSTKRSASGSVSLKGATYSTCDLDHPHFYMKLTKARVVPNDKIVSGPAYLVIADIPFYMLFVPFGYIPNTPDFSSGLLLPTWGEDKAKGFFFRDGGYYFAISDYMDVTLRGEYYTYGSWGASLSTRYKKRYGYTGNLNFTFARNIYGEKGFPDYQTSNDYKFIWSHQQDRKFNPNSTFSSNLNISSSKYDRHNSYDPAEHTRNTKSSSISYSYKWANLPFSMTTSLNHSQSSQTGKVDLTLPQASLTMETLYPLRKEEGAAKPKWYENLSIRYSSKLDNKVYTNDSAFLTDRMWDRMKNGFSHDIPIELVIKVTKSINVTPILKYTGVAYTEYDTYQWNDNTTNPRTRRNGAVDTITHHGLTYAHALYPSVSTGYSPKLFGMYQFRNSRVKALRHVMSPSVSVSYTPDVSDLLPNYYYKYKSDTNRYTETSWYAGNIYGTPTHPPGKPVASVNFALKNNFEMKIAPSANDTSAKNRKISLLDNFDFSGSYDLIADSFNLSNITMQTGTSLFDSKLKIDIRGIFNPYKTDSTGNRVVNSYILNDWEQPARLTDLSLSTSISFSSSELKSKKEDGKKTEQTTEEGDDNSIPWNLNIGYSLTYEHINPYKKYSIIHSCTFSGSLTLTKNWKLGIQSGYDFTNKEFNMTSINITRDLHCWQMTFNVIPFGSMQSYSFNISAKAAILQDLKYSKVNQSWRGRY